MGSSAKGGGSTTVTQDNEPPKWAQPLFKQSANVAQNLYKSGAGFNIYPGSTVAAPSKDTKLGSQGLANIATSSDSYDLAQNPVNLTNQMLSQGGMMAPAQSAMDFFGNVAGGQHDSGTGDFARLMGSASNLAPGADAKLGQFAQGDHGGIGTWRDYRDIYGRAQESGAAEDYLTSTARGDYIEDGNPHFRALLDREAENIGDRVSGAFASGGRYGSGAHQGVLGETTSDFMLKGLSEDFNRERAAQMTAAQAIEAAQLGRMGQQQQAVQGMTGVHGQNIANQMQALFGQRKFAGDDWQREMGAAQSLFGAEQQNLQNQMGAAGKGADLSNQGLMQALGYMNALPTIQQNRTFAPNLLLQSGAVQDQANQAQINDMVSRYHQQDMAPWTRLGALQAAATGSAGPYGMVHTQSNSKQSPGILGMLGGAMQLATPFF